MKTICTPKSAEAMDRLDMDSCIDGDLVELNFPQDNFEKLWSSGLFDELNRALSIMIDDFEDEKIVGESVDEAILVLDRFIDSGKAPQNIFLEIRRLLNLAKKNRTGLFFYF
jgi:hypothetical protein